VENAIQEAGGTLASKVCEFMMQDGAEGEMGETVGWLAGTIAFEVALAALTAGGATAAKGAMKVLQTFAKILDWTGEALGLAFKALAKVGGYVLDAVKGIGKLLSKAGGAAKTLLDALATIGRKLIAFADELLGITKKVGKGAAGEVAEEAAEKTAKEAAEAGAEKTAKEAAEAGAEKGAKEGAEEGAEKTAKETSDDAARKAAELPAAIAAATAITETNDVVNTPALILIGMLTASVKPQYSWIKGFEARPKQPGHYSIHMIASDHEIDADYTTPAAEAVEAWRDQLDRKSTPSNNLRDEFEITHTGPDNFLVKGNGEEVWADGIRSSDQLLLEAKCVSNPSSSPFIPGSQCPDFIRKNIVAQIEDEFRRYAAVIADSSTPVKGLEVIVNDKAAQPFFEGLLEKYNIPGRVVVP